jgi:hypothetical protein
VIPFRNFVLNRNSSLVPAGTTFDGSLRIENPGKSFNSLFASFIGMIRLAPVFNESSEYVTNGFPETIEYEHGSETMNGLEKRDGGTKRERKLARFVRS